MSTGAETAPEAKLAVGGAVLIGVRLGTLLMCSVLLWLLLRSLFHHVSFPPTMLWANLAILPVNIVCFVMVRRRYRGEGKTFAQALGIRPGRLGHDVLWGLLWLVTLNVPFGLVITGTVFALYGADAPQAFQTIFYDPNSPLPANPIVTLVLSLIAVVPFMVLNAPTEELVFRGYGLAAFSRATGPGWGVVITAALFGAQHVLFAATAPAMVVYFVGFTVWGAFAAVIVRRQRRIFPVVVAHWLINILMAAPGIVFPILTLSGVVAA